MLTLLVGIATLAGGVLAFLLSSVERCKEASVNAIASQERLQEEILERREKFARAIRQASSLDALRDFLAHRDALHGFLYAEFRDRSLAELEREEERNGSRMDEPTSLALRLRVRLLHARIDANAERGVAPDAIPANVWDAIEAQDISELTEDAMPALKNAARTLEAWTLEAHVERMRDGKLVEACSVTQALRDIYYDIRYSNQRAIHVQKRSFF